jgi:hypothetical protein
MTVTISFEMSDEDRRVLREDLNEIAVEDGEPTSADPLATEEECMEWALDMLDGCKKDLWGESS